MLALKLKDPNLMSSLSISEPSTPKPNTSHSSNSSHRSAFAVIQAPVLYSKQLNDAEKIIYGHISNLCNEFGYCYATNQYLAELSGKSLAAIKRAIKKLTDLNFIDIHHLPKGKQDERQITLSQFPKSIEKIKEQRQKQDQKQTENQSQKQEIEIKNEGGSKMSYPQLKNELPGGSKMSHRIIKEEYFNKNTTTHTNVQSLPHAANSQNSSSSFKCKNKIQQLENLDLSQSQKQKIYRNFEEKQILKGLKWLESVGHRENPGAALYDALRNDYEPRKSFEEVVLINKKYAQAKLGKYEDQMVKGYKVSFCRQYLEFSAVSGKCYCFDYSISNFKNDLDSFCSTLGIR